MPVDWSSFPAFVRSATRFALLTHVRPDGDALGSQLALASALERLGKTVRVLVASPVPDRYHFLDPDKRIERFTAESDAIRTADAIIVVDTGTWNQLGDCGPAMRERAVPKAVIDHHQTQDDLGAVRYVDTASESCCRLVAEAIDALGVPIDEPTARYLFSGLSMDTGWFRHSNTSERSFELAARLTKAGASPEAIYEHLFEGSPLPRLRLLGRALERMQVVHGGRTALTEVRMSDYAELGAHPQDTEDLVQYTRSVAGVEVGLILIEQPRGGIKVSFRSRERVDVAKLAERFGGGGHMRAAGASLPGTIESARETVLAAVAEALA